MRATILIGFLCLGTISTRPALAEPPAKPPTQSQQGAPTRVDPERLAAAREVVAAAQGDRAAVLAGMRTPMQGMMSQLGIKEPDRARVLVDEVLMPVLSAHYDELLSIQALAFAAVLSKEELKAVAAFYATPSGRALAKAQPQLSQALLVGLQQWIGALAPEMQEKVAQAAQAHGWMPGGNGGGANRPRPN